MQAEWKVAAQISREAEPHIRSRRSFSSPAALLVKVMAMTDQGTAGSTAHSRTACCQSSGEGSSGNCSKKARSSSEAQPGTSSLSLPRPKVSRLSTRLMRTVVLPLPAPARSRRGPSVASTASRWLGFMRAYRRAMTARRAVM